MTFNFILKFNKLHRCSRYPCWFSVY